MRMNLLGIGGTLLCGGDGDLETFFKYTRIAEVDAIIEPETTKIAA